MIPLAAIVVSFNTREVLLRCIAAALPALEELGGRLVVVDNASSDGSADAVAAAYPQVQLVRAAKNRGFAAGVNLGASVVVARRLLLLNPDCFLEGSTALRRCLELLDADPSVAAAGCRLVDRDGLPMLYARPFPTLRGYLAERLGFARPYPRENEGPIEVDSIIGAFFLIDGEAWKDVGPFDERFFLYFEETDWCWRARARGWRLVVDPAITIVHWGGESTKTRADEEPLGARGLLIGTYLDSRERFWRKCYGRLSTACMRAASVAISSIGLVVARLRGNEGRAALERFRIAHAFHRVHGLRG